MIPERHESLAQFIGHSIKLGGIDRRVGVPEVEIGHRVDGQDVQMGMGDLEPGDHQPDSSAREGLTLSSTDVVGHHHQMGRDCAVQINPLIDFDLRNHEAMAPVQRPNVDHDHTVVVIPDQAARNLAGNDSREDRRHEPRLGRSPKLGSTNPLSGSHAEAMVDNPPGDSTPDEGDGPEPREDAPTLYDLDAGVATITLNRPKRKNSLSVELVDSLADNLDQAVADADARLILLTNTGNTFCAGADLKAANPGPNTTARRSFVEILNQILGSPKPVIGRIDGHATGGGVGLVAACDISVMRDDAKIGFTEVRLGVAPAIISVVCLPKMRRSDALELFLTGERISPARAVEVGLITATAEPSRLDEVIQRYASMLIRGGPEALAACKDFVFRVPGMDRDEAFAWTSARSAELFRTDEAAAGIAAFRDRGDAPWIPEAGG